MYNILETYMKWSKFEFKLVLKIQVKFLQKGQIWYSYDMISKKRWKHFLSVSFHGLDDVANFDHYIPLDIFPFTSGT